MQLWPNIDALLAYLAAVAAVGNDTESEAVRWMGGAREASLRLRLLEVFTEAAHELTSQLRGQVQLRLAGADPSLVYVEDEARVGFAVGDETLSARITLRLPGTLKADIEVAAAREAVSVNTWLVQTLARALEQRRGARVGNRLSGFARS